MGVKFPASASAQSTPAASSAIEFKKPFGPIRLTIICAALLSVIVVSGSSFFLYNLHNRIRAVNERDLSNTTLALATQLEQFFTTVESVQAGLLKDIAALGAIDTADGDRLLSRHDVYLKLRDKAAGMPDVGALTIINAKGRLINFSRQLADPGHHRHGSRLLQGVSSQSEFDVIR
jgi:hypothetical protein